MRLLSVLAVLPASADELRCGEYRSVDGGVIDTLDSGDSAQTHVHEGAIHLQQDGRTLVLRKLGNGDLMGMHTHTRYQCYQPVPGTAQCMPPREAPGSA